MKYPFEARPDEVLATPELFVDAVFASLASEFLVMPKGEGFLEYPIFAAAYEALKKASNGFVRLDHTTVLAVALQCPVVLLVLRAILGFTPPEWACVAASRKAMDIPQNAARTLDRRIRSSPNRPLRPGETSRARITALVETACDLIEEGYPSVPSDKLHRFNKADSLDGLSSVRQLANLGTPYAMLLYERLLGRPFAGHRDSVSELVGDGLESVIEDELTKAGLPFARPRERSALRDSTRRRISSFPTSSSPVSSLRPSSRRTMGRRETRRRASFGSARWQSNGFARARTAIR